MLPKRTFPRWFISAGVLICAALIAGWLLWARGIACGPIAPAQEVSARVAPSRSDGATQPVGTALDRTDASAAIVVRVQDSERRGIAGAEATNRAKSKVLGVSTAAGDLEIQRSDLADNEIEFSADGFLPARVAPKALNETRTVTLQERDGHRLKLRLINQFNQPVTGVKITLGAGQPGGMPQRHSETDASGEARFVAVSAGQHSAGLKFGAFDLSVFLQSPDTLINVPCAEVTWRLDLPTIAWVKPTVGDVVVGYFRAPVGPADFGPRQKVLSQIEAHCQRVSPKSSARAFMSPIDEITFIALLNPGGWTVEAVPTFRMSDSWSPVEVTNDDGKPLQFGAVSVRALSPRGEAMDGAPFALMMASASSYGSFTFPIDFSRPQRLPVGQYAFVSLQGGATKLFTGPSGTVAVEPDSDTHLVLQATTDIRRVVIRADGRTAAGEKLEDLGSIQVSDGAGFETETTAAMPEGIWLPTTQPLSARTRCKKGLDYVDLRATFFVSAGGPGVVDVALVEAQ
jgi:hypothetical protein